MLTFLRITCLLIPIIFIGCSEDDTPPVDDEPGRLQISYLRVGTVSLITDDTDIPIDIPIVISFSAPLDRSTVEENIALTDEEGGEVELNFSYLDNDATVSALPQGALQLNTQYTLTITENIEGEEGESFAGFSTTFTTINPPLQIDGIWINDAEVNRAVRIIDISLQPTFEIRFSDPVTVAQLEENISLNGVGQDISLNLSQLNDSAIAVTPGEALSGLERYLLEIGTGLGDDLDRDFTEYRLPFYTQADSVSDFPEISDEELLTKVQEQTFQYFWDFGHPVSGLARERNTSGDLVTSGGSGFGLMAIIVGIERGFISREEGVERFSTIINFLANEADHFHGVWPHWLSGVTGEVIPFSPLDDGGDLVETGFLVQGLLTVRQYLDDADPEEATIIDTINELWESVEWTWYQQEGENVLTWHWSPDNGFELDLEIRGWNEALILYILAASSPTYPIDAEDYHEGWARNGTIQNGEEYYGYELPLGPPLGGPLFFAHYSFLGLDPRHLEDQYANYWTQNTNHTLINWAYSVDNPLNYVGYSENSWGLTASDDQDGYSAHSPTNDLGVITPTAAISSIPYTPERSMDAIRFFYYTLGDDLWGPYGFYDAFNLTEGWTADSYLAIDQGPIVVMIENYRTGLLWDLFMSAPEIQNGLNKLGFTYE